MSIGPIGLIGPILSTHYSLLITHHSSLTFFKEESSCLNETWLSRSVAWPSCSDYWCSHQTPIRRQSSYGFPTSVVRRWCSLTPATCGPRPRPVVRQFVSPPIRESKCLASFHQTVNGSPLPDNMTATSRSTSFLPQVAFRDSSLFIRRKDLWRHVGVGTIRSMVGAAMDD